MQQVATRRVAVIVYEGGQILQDRTYAGGDGQRRPIWSGCIEIVAKLVAKAGWHLSPFEQLFDVTEAATWSRAIAPTPLGLLIPVHVRRASSTLALYAGADLDVPKTPYFNLWIVDDTVPATLQAWHATR